MQIEPSRSKRFPRFLWQLLTRDAAQLLLLPSVHILPLRRGGRLERVRVDPHDAEAAHSIIDEVVLLLGCQTAPEI